MKKSFVFILIVLVFCMFTLVPVNAQEKKGIKKGQFEMTVVGSGSSDEDLDGTTLSAEAGLGYFINDNLELSIRQGSSYADRAGDNDWNGATRLAVDYHFNANPLFPFIGCNFGYLYGDNVEEQFVAGPEAGLKLFASDHAFLFGLLEYEFLLDDPSDIDDNFDDGRFVYSVGIGLTF